MSHLHGPESTEMDIRHSGKDETGREAQTSTANKLFCLPRRWIYLHNLSNDVTIYDPENDLFYELIDSVLEDIQTIYPCISLHVAGGSVCGIIFCYGFKRTKRNSFVLKIWECNPATGEFRKLPPHFEFHRVLYDYKLKKCKVSMTPVPDTSATNTRSCYKLFVIVKLLELEHVMVCDQAKVGLYHSESRCWKDLGNTLPLQLKLLNGTVVPRFRKSDENIYVLKPSFETLLRFEHKLIRFADTLLNMFRYSMCEEDRAWMVEECRRDPCPKISWIKAFERNGQLLWMVMEGDESSKCGKFHIYTKPFKFEEHQATTQFASMLSGSPEGKSASSPLPCPPRHMMISSDDRRTSKKLASMPTSIFAKFHGESEISIGNINSEESAQSSSRETECSCKRLIHVFPVADDRYGDRFLFFNLVTGRIASFNLEHLCWKLTSFRAATTAATLLPDIEFRPRRGLYGGNCRIADLSKVETVLRAPGFQGIVFEPYLDTLV